MKKHLFGVAAILAITAPGAALAQSGYVGAAWSSVEVDDEDADGYGVEGAFAFGGNGGLGFELDASYATSDEDDSDATGVAGHLYSRNETRLIGGFASYIDADVASFWSAGLETEVYMTNWTLAASLGVGSAESDAVDTEADLYGVNAELRYFATDNLRFDGGLGIANIEVDGVGDDDAITYGLGAEWQLGGSPISLLAGWSQAQTDETDIEVSTLSVGLRWNFGAGSLKERDRSGASLAGLSNLSSSLTGL